MMTTDEIERAFIEHAVGLFPAEWSRSPTSVQRKLVEINASAFAHMIELLRKEEKIHNDTTVALRHLKQAGIQPTMSSDELLSLTRGYDDAENA